MSNGSLSTIASALGAQGIVFINLEQKFWQGVILVLLSAAIFIIREVAKHYTNSTPPNNVGNE